MAASLKILVVEDNDELRETTVEVLRGEGHHVTGVDCAEQVPELLGATDLMLIDLNLPGEDGLALARRVRASQPGIGIIMVTARGLLADRKQGYDSGADIYIPKPVALEELSAAIASLARRLLSTEDGRLCLDQARMCLSGLVPRAVGLSVHEVALLAAFSRASDHRMESWQLIELLRKEAAQDPKAALELQIVRLRKKLQEAGAAAPTIQAIRGWGYQLCTPIRLQ